MNKAVFLDRDGTINVEKNYIYRKEDFEFIPGAIEGMKKLQRAGFILVLVTNQSGIARGYYTEEQYHILNKWMEEQLKSNGIKITASYYCPHHPSAKIKKYQIDCNCRKPRTGMYERAVYSLNIDMEKSFSIGDRIRDCSICNVTSCKGYLIGHGESMEVIRMAKRGKLKNIQYAIDLYDAANKIIMKMVQNEEI